MTDTERRLSALEARLQAAEDEIAIIRLISSYGPMVDSGSTDHAPALFSPDGVYDVDIGRMIGPGAISDMLGRPGHQDLVAKGIAHVMGLPWVRLSGDTAVAVNCTRLYLCQTGGYSLFRVAQNVWKLQRQADGGWAVKERTNRLISDDLEARDLLRGAL
ncbi:nuclear transport factor 2 family protein [Rhizobium sp. CRIBSB]|nr:nuclear transport factor 2 family protein [Rhizobium sp. CRIBSB]